MNDEFGADEPEPQPYVPSLLDADLSPDEVAAWAASVDPGSAVAKPLAALDLARLSAAGQVDALVATQRDIAWLQARQQRLLAVMVATPVMSGPVGELDGFVRTWPARCGCPLLMRRSGWFRRRSSFGCRPRWSCSIVG